MNLGSANFAAARMKTVFDLRPFLHGGIAFAVALFATGHLDAADWPMWRHNSSRSAATSEELPATLHLQWSLDLPSPRPAWDTTQDRLQFDASYEPVAAGGRLFVPSMVNDSVTAYELASGKRLWQFFANGPVRFAPACWGDAVYFGSDDGYLYCVAAADGVLRWKFRGGPNDRKVLGNKRIISTWPARGGLVIDDGIIYFAAGVWPFMGIFIHALDAKTGEVVWSNSGSGSNYLVQPHNSPAFAGVSPQGYLALTSDTLIVPGGRGSPAGYDRATGRFLYCHVGTIAKTSGGYAPAVVDNWFALGPHFCRARDGRPIGGGQLGVATDNYALLHGGGNVAAIARTAKSEQIETVDRRGDVKVDEQIKLEVLWQRPIPREIRALHLQAADTLIASDGESTLYSFKLPTDRSEPKEASLAPSWMLKIVGHISSAIVADQRLVIVNRQGQILCYGAGDRRLPLPALPAADNDSANEELVLLPRGARWSYLDDGQAPPEKWNATDFDAAAWKNGLAKLGYGDGDEATTVNFGPDRRNKFIATYLRRVFDVPADAKFSKVQLQASIDDGAVVYLNGQEISRINMPGDAVNHTTRATGASAEGVWQTLAVDPQQLVAGANVLAVSVHQCDPSSSDISFDLELTAEHDAAERLQLATGRAAHLAELAQQSEGYCLIVNPLHIDEVLDFVEQTHFDLIVLEANAEKADAFRQELPANKNAAGRVAVLQGELRSSHLPHYLFNAMILPSTVDASALQAMVESLRPYGGTAMLATDDRQHASLAAIVPKLAKNIPALANIKVDRRDGYTAIVREGPLPGSAPWTQQAANAANTLASADTLVKAPLGVLWFGGPSHEGVLPRHGHGPTPQVVGGRLFIEGRDMLRAVDVYTGRLLWQRNLPEVGLYYDNTAHHPGANAIGSNYVSLADGIYVAYKRECLRLDPASGKTLSTFTLPADASGERPFWGYIGVDGDRLIAGSSPVLPLVASGGVDRNANYSRYGEGSARLVVLDRHSGKLKWSRDATFHFRHNAICAGDGKVFCIDRVSDAHAALLKRRGEVPQSPPTLYALDAETGRVVWQSSDKIFGTWLSYSAEHGVVVQATSKNRDRAPDEPGSGLAVYRAATGQRLWISDRGYGGPVLLLGDRIVTQGNAVELLTGNEAMRTDPITGQPARWTFTRNYGCTTAIGCPNLLTFRSAAAGFFDLAGDGGTGNLGGFRSSCTANLVPADGVLNAPDYTRTCTCNYQLQTSLALVHMPEAEMWTFQQDAWNGDRVRRIGINFGAPGDRRDGEGTLWMEYPSVAGRSPDVPVKVEGASENDLPQYAREHASAYGDSPLPWVAASRVRGARTITITLTTDKNAPVEPHRVRLVFARNASSDHHAQFDVALQERKVMEDYAPAKSASAVDIHTFTVAIGDRLTIQLTPTGRDATTTLAGVEIVRE